MTDALHNPDVNQTPAASGYGADDTRQVSSCCLRVVDALSHINTMMVCSDCKQIIKTFREEKSYRNYLKFCQGRSRVIHTGYYKGQHLVVYHSYDV